MKGTRQNARDRVERLLDQLLSQKWVELPREYPAIDQWEKPGVYLIAFTRKNLERQKISLSDVYYIGMSNARTGVNGRLKKFADAIEGKRAKHFAGKRFFKDVSKGTPYSQLPIDKRFFVAGVTISCQAEKEKGSPEDLRMMGDVAALEYYALAAVKKATGFEPPLNRK